MGIIYSNGTRTRIWLGKSPDAEQLYADAKRSTLSPDLKVTTRVIGNNMYWTRAWIVQEVLLSTHRTIHVSHVCVEWEMLQALYDRLHSALNDESIRYTQDDDDFLASRAISFLRQLHDGNMRLESQSFRQLLKHHKFTHCTLWQDRVFALLPLSSGGRTFTINYQTSPYELVFEALRIFNHGQCLCWVHQLAIVCRINSHVLAREITSVDFEKLMRPLLELRVYVDNTSLDGRQGQDDRSRYIIDPRNTIPFNAELDIELGSHSQKQKGVERWRCRRVNVYTQAYHGSRRSIVDSIHDSDTCSSIEIFRSESTSALAGSLTA